MEQENKNISDGCQIDRVDTEHESINLFNENGLCDKLIERIMSMPDELRDKYECSVAVQGAGVIMPKLGLDYIEIKPAKVQLIFSPVRNK